MRQPSNFYNENQQLFGVLETPPGITKPPGVLILHGIAGTRIEPHRLLVQLSEALCRRGIASLRFDFRGCGDSEGTFASTTFSSMLSDAEAAMNHLAVSSDVDDRRMGLLGLSLGGALAASLVGRTSCFRALALWAPMAEFVPEWFEGLYQDLERTSFADMQGDLVSRTLVDELRACQPLEDVTHFSGPAFLAHGTKDEIVPFSHSEAYQSVLSSRGVPVEFHRIPEADHTFNAVSWTNELVEKTADWFMETLATRPR